MNKSLCENCKFGLALGHAARDVMYAPQTKDIPIPGPPKEEWVKEENQETMEVEDHTQPPIGHEVIEHKIVSLCYYNPEGTGLVNRPVWAGPEVTNCSRFCQKDLTEPAEEV